MIGLCGAFCCAGRETESGPRACCFTGGRGLWFSTDAFPREGYILKKTLYHLYEGFAKTKAAITAAALVLYLVLVAYCGGSVAEWALFALVLLGYIVLPGLLAARVLRVEKLAAGYFGPLAVLLGTGFFAVLYCFSMRLQLLWLLRVLPPVLSAVFVGWSVWRLYRGDGKAAAKSAPRKIWHTRPQAYQWMLILLFAALLVVYTFAGVVKNARPSAVGDMLLNHDMLWNVGNANSFKLAFPPQDIRFFDVRLHYHYLTELVAGALSLVSGISAYNIIAFYMQPFVLAAMLLCLFRFGRLLWQKENEVFKPLLFTWSLFLFSCASLWKILPNGTSVFWNGNIRHLITNINSQATAVMYLCIFCGLFVAAARKKYKAGVLHTLLLICAFVMLCFAKGPLAALVTVALVLTLLIGLFQKRTGVRGMLLGTVLAGLFLVIYFAMFSSGANDSMRFSWTGTLSIGYFGNILELIWHKNYYLWLVCIPFLWVLQSFLMMPAQFPLFARGMGRDARRFASLPPERLLFNAVAIGGLLAYFLFVHPSMSQVYFLFAAVFFVNLLAVDNIEYLRWPAKNSPKGFKTTCQKVFVCGVAVCGAVGVLTTGFLYVNMIGSGARQLAWDLGIVEKYPYAVVVTPDDEAAMLWLRDNSPQDAMFATNRIHTEGHAEGISNLYSAFCERQGYMEGFQYAKTNMGVDEKTIVKRIQTNDALFSPATEPEQVVQLCREAGIDYLVYSTQYPGTDTQMSEMVLVYDSPMVRIYQLPEA